MSRADELWEKYSYDTDGYSGGIMPKHKFLAALKEYGAEVRKEDVNVAERLFETTIDRGEHTPDDYVYSENVAAAIESKPLP